MLVFNTDSRQLHMQMKKSLVAQTSESGNSIDKEVIKREIYNQEVHSEVCFLCPLFLFFDSNVSRLVIKHS